MAKPPFLPQVAALVDLPVLPMELTIAAGISWSAP